MIRRPYIDRRVSVRMTRLDRVMRHVVPTGDCWLWTGCTTNGYGRLSIQQERGLYAHRVVYEEMVGPIPPGLHIDHLCRNRACVNPDHLEPVTPVVNTRRGIGHGSETHCPQGHAYDETNTYRWGGRRYCRACQKARRNREAASTDDA